MFIGDATNNVRMCDGILPSSSWKAWGTPLGVVGLAGAAPAWGWEPVDGDPFESGLIDVVHDVARTLHGVPRSTSLGAGSSSAELGQTMFHDVYRMHGRWSGRDGGECVDRRRGDSRRRQAHRGQRHRCGGAVDAPADRRHRASLAGTRAFPARRCRRATRSSSDAAHPVVGIGTPRERPRDAGDATAGRGPRRLGVRRRRDDVRVDLP